LISIRWLFVLELKAVILIALSPTVSAPHRTARPLQWLRWWFACLLLLGMAQTPAFAVTPMVVAGGSHSCALSSAGAVTCWGLNNYAQLGNGTTTSSSIPVPVTGLSSGVTAIAAGANHTCAIVNGAAKCWGFNGMNLLLGDGSLVFTSSTPVQVSGLTAGVTAITAGASHTCALVNGAMQCWGGSNSSGELGNGTRTSSRTPVQVSVLPNGNITAIAAGDIHTCAVINGAAQCWGSNGNGQLGNGSTISSTTPVQVSGLTAGVTALAADMSHTCAVVNGAAKCWGFNTSGQLGNGSTTNSTSPVQVSGLTIGITAIVAGSYYTCTIDNNNTAKCWGSNIYGQLGNNTIVNSSIPVPVNGLSSGVTAITGGSGQACAIVNGVAKCWGSNSSGQLGNGTTTNSKVPVAVLTYQVISFGTAPSLTYGGAAGTVSATATSNLAVTYTSMTTGICTVSGNAVTPLAIGTCTIAADQAGDANHNVALQVTQNITVAKADQATLIVTVSSHTITHGNTATLGYGGGSGTGVVTYASNNANCTISGNTLVAAAVGSCVITATQAADVNYMAATGTVSITVMAVPTPPVTPTAPVEGNAGNTVDAGQELLMVGGTTVRAGNNGGTIQATGRAGVFNVSVTSGSMVIPCLVALPLCTSGQNTLTVLVGETVRFTSDGKVSSIQINPATPNAVVTRLNGKNWMDTMVGMLQAKVPALGAEVVRKTDDWNALMLEFSLGKLSVTAPLPMQVNPTLADDVRYLPNGTLQVVTNGVIVHLIPALLDKSHFHAKLQGWNPNADMRENGDGTISIHANRILYSVRPHWLSAHDGEQSIFPATYSFDQFSAMVATLDSSATLLMQLNGKLALTVQGTTYTLTPDYEVSLPMDGTPSGFVVRGNKLVMTYLFGFTQGFTVERR
ncbi:MAG: hypothetical protein RLZZ495_1321, partial [Pseudomonadota bacterium]